MKTLRQIAVVSAVGGGGFEWPVLVRGCLRSQKKLKLRYNCTFQCWCSFHKESLYYFLSLFVIIFFYVFLPAEPLRMRPKWSNHKWKEDVRPLQQTSPLKLTLMPECAFNVSTISTIYVNLFQSEKKMCYRRANNGFPVFVNYNCSYCLVKMVQILIV